ncbi:ATP-binding protein [Sphingobacterium endophyticum]|uniref:ATP-binding protein n=1 Tax=Sphingobacterium endophyticum TaxID=2546448 RepID=UPI0012E320BB|nr:ATP-binding protein [Sphingobacterium endophyticum]
MQDSDLPNHLSRTNCEKLLMDNQIIVEDENLYLSEGIQEFGYLLIVNLECNLVAGSENCKDWLEEDLTSCLGKDLWVFLQTYFPIYLDSIKKAVDQVLQDSSDRVLLEIMIHEKSYFLNIYLFNNYIYLEFEKRIEDSTVFFPKFEIADKLLSDNRGKIWEVVCSYISKISGFDRIRVFQYVEGGNGLIVAESNENPELEGILNCYYPDMDIFKHAKNVHSVNIHRYTANVDGETIKVISNGIDEPNLSQTNVRMISPIHAYYLKKEGVNSNFSVSIQVEGKLWGYIFCQSQHAKSINLLKREALVYFIQLAANRYHEEEKFKIREYQEDIRNFELQLKEKLILKNNLAESLMDLASELCYYAKSDSMIIMINGQIYSYHISIGSGKLFEIKEMVKRIAVGDTFADHEFILNYGKFLEIESDRFAGIGGLHVNLNDECTIIWFRKEKEFTRKWVEKPVSRIEKQLINETFTHEPHSSLDIWHQKTVGTSEVWQEDELYFIKRLREIIIQSNKNFAQEIDKLNKEVGNLNRALDNYANTVSHDLKNPLSAINLSTQLLLQRPNMKEELRNKMLKNTKDAVDVIGELLRSVHEFSKIKDYEYKFEPVYVDEFLAQIVNFSQLRYGAEQTEISLGDILPVYGERTIVYQLFQNLIGNAIKYSAKVERPKVKITSEVQHEFICYRIEDNGIGIAKEELGTIYDSFKRMSNAGNYEGTGLGLTIVKRIADRLKIKIEVQSKLGKGTQINLLFPNER